MDDGRPYGIWHKKDAMRTEWLEAQGYKVIRFTNERILCETDNVISELRTYL